MNYRQINIRRGEEHWNTKLTKEKVREIRKRCKRGEKQIAIGMKFGISPSQVSLIASRYSWKDC